MTLEELVRLAFGWDVDRAVRAVFDWASPRTCSVDASRVRGLMAFVPCLSHVRMAIPVDVVVSVSSFSIRTTWRDRTYVVVDQVRFDEWVADIRRRFVAEAM